MPLQATAYVDRNVASSDYNLWNAAMTVTGANEGKWYRPRHRTATGALGPLDSRGGIRVEKQGPVGGLLVVPLRGEYICQ